MEATLVTMSNPIWPENQGSLRLGHHLRVYSEVCISKADGEIVAYVGTVFKNVTVQPRPKQRELQRGQLLFLAVGSRIVGGESVAEKLHDRGWLPTNTCKTGPECNYYLELKIKQQETWRQLYLKPERWVLWALSICTPRALNATLPFDLYYRHCCVTPTQIVSSERLNPLLGFSEFSQIEPSMEPWS